MSHREYTAAPAVYSKSQIIEYFDRICLPKEYRNFDLGSQGIDPMYVGLFLDRIVEQHLISVPFENLTLHYSNHRTINLDPQHVFNKIVRHPGRGGYCMENNTLFHHILLALGLNVYMAGARVYDVSKGRYGGFQHCVNIVTIGEEAAAVDLGFGARGPLRALILSTGQQWNHIEPARCRLRHDSIPQARNTKQKHWIYEYGDTKVPTDWVPQYCFTETEFLPQDLDVMNYMTSTNSESIFVQKVMCVRFTRMDESNRKDWKDRLAGQIDLLSNTEDERETYIKGAFIIDGESFKWRAGDGKLLSEMKFQNETERLEILAVYFGIKLDEAETQAIRGTATEVRNQ
ncbi:Fc.00g114870.m01.CDS01 [Cosmosporella sp. VM-42]